ncbi:hypothetical protein ACOMHN_023055 [Nucella lapillus]
MLEKIQSRAARWVTHRHRKTSSVQDMLETLHWPPLTERRRKARLSGGRMAGLRTDSTLMAIPKQRVISHFPQPYHPDASPYQTIQFHPKVKAACAENRTGRVGLKICKAVIVGDVAVGKTCVVQRFCHNVFNRDYKATIGVDFEVEKFSILSVPFTLQM